MNFVCLWSPAWATAGESLAEIAAPLLADVPRVAVGAGVLWADTRGLPAVSLARALVVRLGAPAVRAGVAAVPVAAEAAARTGAEVVAVVEPGAERALLAPLPLEVLGPERRLARLLRGAGVGSCGALAALPREAVEVRFGAAGAALWRLARADDPRLLFAPVPPEAPHASLHWPESAVRDVARLAFALNGLLGSVCATLATRGERARTLHVELALEGGGTLCRQVRAARPSAERGIWLARLREELERTALPDVVVGIALRVEDREGAGGRQGDLFDRGFGSAAAVEEAVARLLDGLGPVVVAPEASAHPLPEARTVWRTLAPDDAATGAAVPPTPPSGLTLQRLPEPRPLVVRSRPRRDHLLPVAYREGRTWRTLVEGAGPDRVSGGHGGEPFAREYYRCVTDEGRMVWLFRDVRTGGWYLHGWWD